MKRRAFLRAAGAAALAAVGLATYGVAVEPGELEVVEETVPITGLGAGLEGLRAVQLSDFHASTWFPPARLEAVIERALALRPEIIWLTGDYVLAGQNPYRSLEEISAPLRALQQQAPVYAVLGNHDYVRDQPRLVADALEGLGLHHVTNRYERFERGGDALIIAGIGTVSNGDMHLDALARDLPLDAPVVLLAHEPDTAQWSAAKGRFALQVSGHSHGGQVVVPPVGPLILPWMGELYPAGRYTVGEMALYTNRGLGTSHIPVRINCLPEITVFTLTRA